MLIGINGRGGTGKSTLAKLLVSNHNNIEHIEVDKLIDNKLSISKTLITRVNNTINKEYTFNDIKNSFFKDDHESKIVRNIFTDEINKLIVSEIKDNKKDYIIEHFTLNQFEVFKECDIKVKLIASKKEREERIKKRKDMSLELYRSIDKRVLEDNEYYDSIFNIKDYQKELISIIIPIYNSEEYIEKTILSVINQTYQNLEIILVNDGSTDNTLNIISKYKDPRIRLITTTHKNVSHARNIGLKYAKGEYISFIDSDDLINKDYISCLYDSIKISNSDFSNSEIIVKKDNKEDYISNKKNNITIINNPKEAYLKVETKFSVWGKLFKKDLIKDLKFQEISCFEDFKYMWEVSKKAKKTIIVPSAIYKYIKRNKSLTEKKYDDSNKELINHAYKVLKETKTKDGKKFFYGCLLLNIALFLKSHDEDTKYNKEIFKCLILLEKYKDYKFNLLGYEQIDIDEIINFTKNTVGIKTIGLFWNQMKNKMDDAIHLINEKSIIIDNKRIILSKREMKDFIKKVYPRNPSDSWKTKIKINYLLENKNYINIVNLLLPKYGYEYNERKDKVMYKGIDEFKQLIREEYKDKVNKYLFDNVFHMTDDEKEYYNLSSILDEYILLENKRKNGRIILDNEKFQYLKNKDKRKKYKYNNWLFKEIRENSYEDYAELFSEEVYKLFKMNNVYYDLARLNNKDGVIYYDSLNQVKYISAKDLISEVIETNDINEIMKYNNYNSLINIIKKYCLNNNIKMDNIDNLLFKIKKIMIIDLLLLQSDRNPNNYGFIIGRHLELSRVFDNSNALGANHIKKDPYYNRVLLTVDNSNYNYYEEIENNKGFYNLITKDMAYLENNLENIFAMMEIKIERKIPRYIKKYIKQTLKVHFSNIKKIA